LAEEQILQQLFLLQVLSSLYQTNKLFNDEAILKTLNEQQFLCQASLVSINEEYNDTLILTFTDISQLKAAENARSEALSFLSHDLRSPMVSALAIFDCFTRLKNSESTEGAGLGLNFVATVVKKHQGEITLISELNVASSFMLHIPALSEYELFDV
jgi:signal transduction histidine kinase